MNAAHAHTHAHAPKAKLEPLDNLKEARLQLGTSLHITRNTSSTLMNPAPTLDVVLQEDQTSAQFAVLASNVAEESFKKLQKEPAAPDGPRLRDYGSFHVFVDDGIECKKELWCFEFETDE